MKSFLNKKTIAAFLIILLFTLPTVLPLLHKGFFLSDDGEWMVIRLTAFFEALRHGQFPTRFLLRLNNEYGYPLSNFAYPGFLYIGSVIHLFKFGYIVSIKILIFFSLLVSSIFTYLFLREKFDEVSALLGSFIYLYTPYHLFDLYRRGSIGELLSISVIPFLFWQIERGNKYLLALGVFLLILSHNIIAFISLPFVFTYSIIKYRKNIKQKWLEIITPYALGVSMSAFFFIPAIYDIRFIVFRGLKIADWHFYFADLKILGISAVFIISISLFLYIKKKNGELLFFILLSLFSCFMATALSTKIWEIIPSSFILFPYRFLSILPIGLAFLSAVAISTLKSRRKYILILVLLLISSYSTFFFQSPTRYLDTNDNYYLNNFATTTANNEYTPNWVRERPLDIPLNRAEIIRGKASIISQDFNSKQIKVYLTSNSDAILKINVEYFPGWIAYVDGKTVPIDFGNKEGVMQIRIASGDHNIVLKYEEIGIHLYSDIISILGLILLVTLFLKEKLNVSRKN